LLFWVAQGAGPEFGAPQLYRIAALRTFEQAEPRGFGDLLLSWSRVAGKDKNCQMAGLHVLA
jgi:hypothetical protein